MIDGELVDVAGDAPRAAQICPACERELWTHSREEQDACRAELGGFAILCGPRGATRVALPPPGPTNMEGP